MMKLSLTHEFLKVLLPSLLFSTWLARMYITSNLYILVLLGGICSLFSWKLANQAYESKRLQLLEQAVNNVLAEKGLKMNEMAEIVPISNTSNN